MKPWIQNSLNFIHLLDDQNRLSITNIAVIVLVVKVAAAPLDWPTAAGLLCTLLNYGHKRIIDSKTTVEDVKELTP